MLDENSWYLNEYMFQQDKLEEDWIMSLEEKQDKVVELAVKIIQQDVNNETFCIAFEQEFLQTDEDEVTLFQVLEDLVGITDASGYDPELQDFVVELALEAACFCLYDANLDDVFPEDYQEAFDRVYEQLIVIDGFDL